MQGLTLKEDTPFSVLYFKGNRAYKLWVCVVGEGERHTAGGGKQRSKEQDCWSGLHSRQADPTEPLIPRYSLSSSLY